MSGAPGGRRAAPRVGSAAGGAVAPVGPAVVLVLVARRPDMPIRPRARPQPPAALL